MARRNSSNDFFQISDLLNDYVAAVNKDVDEAARETAEEACATLKATSPVRKGKYKRGWKMKKLSGSYVIYNTHYQLTHLLEHGHDIVSHGQKKGRTKAQPHVKPAKEKALQDFENKIKEKIENEH